MLHDVYQPEVTDPFSRNREESIKAEKSGKDVAHKCPCSQFEPLKESIDPDALYHEKREGLSTFDRCTCNLWKGLFSTGKHVGRNGWNAIASLGDAFWWTVDKFADLFPGKNIKNPYMYADYEDEFDLSLDSESSEYLQKMLESPN
ncbi:cellobiose dehydrogenase, putative [Babesia ovis]|uniref:Cellobiose dehydrogenase, putative n=1 Tax=Babesia ovis TaxID=5869 RepID=A0A9W5TBB6_BABOV|nr:cellobiose dehydrogenase, putative [Babesia ovis]